MFIFVSKLKRKMTVSMATRRNCRLLPYIVVTSVIFVYFLHYHAIGRIAGGDSTVYVHVIEEHHEALPHWFEAVKRGTVPEKDNVLIHIDGHSDDAPPQFVKGYPKYRYPKTKEELRTMMQSNDMFIPAAVMAGMFKKVIWIWPVWDKENHEKVVEVSTVHYGVYKQKSSTEEVVCLCRENAEMKETCYYLNRTALEDSDGDIDDFMIKPKLCSKKGQYIFEEIDEVHAVQKMKSGTWFEENDNIVIDIDEDYFGCESAGSLIAKQGPPWVLILSISAAISSIMCPSTTKHEAEGEKFLMPIILEAIKACKIPDPIFNCEEFEGKIQKYATKVLEKGMQEHLPFLCNDSKTLRENMKRFVHHLLILNQPQLKAVARTGLCMLTTPKSSLFNKNGKSELARDGMFRICTGFNNPNDTVVTYYSPTVADVRKRVETLHSILAQGIYPDARLVTICRSVRDGFTPRSHFETIERSILDILRTRYRKDKYVVVYDQDLLGGPEGWPKKHRNIV